MPRRPNHSFSGALAVGVLLAAFATIWTVVLGLAPGAPESGEGGSSLWSRR